MRIVLFVCLAAALLCFTAGASPIQPPLATQSTVSAGVPSAHQLGPELSFISAVAPIDREPGESLFQTIKRYCVFVGWVLLALVLVRLALAFRLSENL